MIGFRFDAIIFLLKIFIRSTIMMTCVIWYFFFSFLSFIFFLHCMKKWSCVEVFSFQFLMNDYNSSLKYKILFQPLIGLWIVNGWKHEFGYVYDIEKKRSMKAINTQCILFHFIGRSRRYENIERKNVELMNEITWCSSAQLQYCCQ